MSNLVTIVVDLPEKCQLPKIIGASVVSMAPGNHTEQIEQAKSAWVECDGFPRDSLDREKIKTAIFGGTD